MRKILLLFVALLVMGAVKAQNLDSLQIIEKAKDIFKRVQVDLTFKDPYSYELLKIEADPVDLKEKLEFDIRVLKDAKRRLESDTTFYLSDFNKNKNIFEAQVKNLKKGEKLKNKDYNKYLEKYSQNIKWYQESLKELTDYRRSIKKCEEELEAKLLLLQDKNIDFKKIVQWKISLDCYGANSYGNKILGRYIFRVNDNGGLDGSIIKTN
ncbi:Uncharacterised protein [Sphingobacterium spiritivorum]|uniref:Uncharacterized protein n=1 Tax=Sphingobacterium spiritivorum TaxID=258 RepID=A0A380CFW8_SPHSI|nr:hypothetical protein [Sphingobacterium spiritivorum]SUJ19118.1 Uncharacterised protein [Sphingobacterium spiritivorum]